MKIEIRTYENASCGVFKLSTQALAALLEAYKYGKRDSTERTYYHGFRHGLMGRPLDMLDLSYQSGHCNGSRWSGCAIPQHRVPDITITLPLLFLARTGAVLKVEEPSPEYPIQAPHSTTASTDLEIFPAGSPEADALGKADLSLDTLSIGFDLRTANVLIHVPDIERITVAYNPSPKAINAGQPMRARGSRDQIAALLQRCGYPVHQGREHSFPTTPATQGRSSLDLPNAGLQR